MQDGKTRLQQIVPERSTSFVSPLIAGYYIYIETSRHSANDSARILSPMISTQGPTCVLFWYHMYGADVNRLNLYSKTASSSTLGQPYWTKIGTQGDRWLSAQVEFSRLPNNQVSSTSCKRQKFGQFLYLS